MDGKKDNLCEPSPVKSIDGLTGEQKTPLHKNIDLGKINRYQFSIIDENLYVGWQDTRKPEEVSSFIEEIILDSIEEAIDEDIILMSRYMGTTWDSKMTLTKGTIRRLNGRRIWEYVKPASEELEVLSTSMLAFGPEVRVFASATDRYCDQKCLVKAPIGMVLGYSTLGPKIAKFANDNQFTGYFSEIVKNL